MSARMWDSWEALVDDRWTHCAVRQVNSWVVVKGEKMHQHISSKVSVCPVQQEQVLSSKYVLTDPA